MNKIADTETNTIAEQPISLNNSRVFIPLIITIGIFLFLIVFNYLSNRPSTDSPSIFATINFFLPLVGLFCIFWILTLVKEELYVPFIHIRNWSLRLKEKDYTARLPSVNKTEFSKLAKDLNNLSEVLQFLSDEFQSQVKQHTSKIKDQNDSLNILYEITTTINESNNVDDLNHSFLQILTKLTSAKAGIVRLATDDNQLKMVASIGLTENFISQECIVPVDRCLCGQSYFAGKTAQSYDIKQCNKLNNTELFQDEQLGIVSVPIDYQGKLLGVFNLFIDHNHINIKNKDHEDLLITVGKHLGMAFEKFHLTQETREHSVIKERTILAHELHDSLAQTLTGIRFKVTILEENLNDSIAVSKDEILGLHENIDQAYTEVRALISHFRGPMDDKGFMPSVQKLIDRFKVETNINVFFQNDWQQQKMKPEFQLQVIRIIQESLNNIKKHSQATTVRVMIKSHSNHNEVLIEDDGIGIDDRNVKSTSLGEHIGLSVMEERAIRMGGQLKIESETGDGTQILLSFPNQASSQKTVHFLKQ